MSAARRVRIPKPGMVREYALAALKGPPIARTTVLDIFEAAGLGVPKSVRNLAHGWRTSVVLVATADVRFVVRRYPDRWSDAAVEHEQSLLQALATRDFPAPRLIELGKDSYLRVVDGARYSVLSFEEGATLAGFYLTPGETGRLLRLSGQVLAGFHRVLAGFVPMGSHHLGLDLTTGRQRRDLDWHLEVIDRLMGKDVMESLAFADDISIGERLIELDNQVGNSELPTAIVHGDYGMHNIIFRHSGEAVVHDFELSRPDIRLVDVAASLSRVRLEYRSHLIQGLLDAGGIDDSELALLDEVWEWYRLRGAIQSAEAYTRLGGAHRHNAVIRRVAEARDLRSGREMIPNGPRSAR